MTADFEQLLLLLLLLPALLLALLLLAGPNRKTARIDRC
jgi:hypothetical protein